MMLRVTTKCSMGCTHCMVESTPDGINMDSKVFEQAIVCIKRFNPGLIFITGGEPFDHPDILFMLKKLKSLDRALMILSNGLKLQDDNFREKVLTLGIPIQVVNDERYYPTKVTIPKNPLMLFADTIPHEILPIGRAKNLTNYNDIYPPKCFNIRSITRSGDILISSFLYTLPAIIEFQELRGKFCNPTIEYDGSIKLGEALCCTPVGTVYDTPDTILQNIRNCSCSNCGLIKNVRKNIRAQGGFLE